MLGITVAKAIQSLKRELNSHGVSLTRHNTLKATKWEAAGHFDGEFSKDTMTVRVRKTPGRPVNELCTILHEWGHVMQYVESSTILSRSWSPYSVEDVVQAWRADDVNLSKAQHARVARKYLAVERNAEVRAKKKSVTLNCWDLTSAEYGRRSHEYLTGLALSLQSRDGYHLSAHGREVGLTGVRPLKHYLALAAA